MDSECRNGAKPRRFIYQDFCGQEVLFVSYSHRNGKRHINFLNSADFVVNRKDVPAILYNLVAVSAAIESGKPILLCGDEEETELAIKRGHSATTIAGGIRPLAGETLEMLSGAQLVVSSRVQIEKKVKAALYQLNDKCKRISVLKDSLNELSTDPDEWHLVLFGEAAARETTPQVPKISRIDEIEESPIEWISPGFIPRQCIGFVVSQPGAGKSQWLAYACACLSMGECPFTGSHLERRQSVLYITSEETEGIIRDRCTKYPYSVEHLYIAEWQNIGSVAVLDGIAAKTHFDIIVIDTLVGSLTRAIDPNNPTQVRFSLNPFMKLAMKTNALILFAAHTRKAVSDFPDLRDHSGSTDYGACARVHYTIRTSLIEDRNSELFLHQTKNTYAQRQQTVKFRLDNRGIKLIGPVSSKDPQSAFRSRLKVDEAVELIKAMLLPDPCSSEFLSECMKRNGISPRTFARAKQKLNVICEGSGRSATYRLPDLEDEGEE